MQLMHQHHLQTSSATNSWSLNPRLLTGRHRQTAVTFQSRHWTCWLVAALLMRMQLLLLQR
jgi:hypothetical protein